MSTRSARFAAVILGFAVLGVTEAACSDGDGDDQSSDGAGGDGQSKPCNEDPWQCPAGQTCWGTDVNGSAFACLNSGSGKAGDPCQNIVSSPTCGDGLACFALQGGGDPVCT